VGVCGNEKAVHSGSQSVPFLSPHEISPLPLVTELICEKWQQFWNSCTLNKLQAVRPVDDGYRYKHISSLGCANH